MARESKSAIVVCVAVALPSRGRPIMIRWMFCLIAAAYLLQPVKAACTATITNPTAASIQPGVVNWTMTTSGCPSAYSATWQLDDFYNIGVVYGPLFTLTNYNTGTPTDGPFNVRVILRDATGAVAESSNSDASTLNYRLPAVTMDSNANSLVLLSFQGTALGTYCTGSCGVLANWSSVSNMMYGLGMGLDPAGDVTALTIGSAQ